MTVGDNATIDGAVACNGEDAANVTSGSGGGGGGGGSVWLVVSGSLKGNGVVTANGGAGAGGGGAGGRVVLDARSLQSWRGVVHTFGGATFSRPSAVSSSLLDDDSATDHEDDFLPRASVALDWTAGAFAATAARDRQNDRVAVSLEAAPGTVVSRGRLDNADGHDWNELTIAARPGAAVTGPTSVSGHLSASVARLAGGAHAIAAAGLALANVSGNGSLAVPKAVSRTQR